VARVVGEVLEVAREALVAFLVATFPEHAKQEGRLAAYSSTSWHVVSGGVEVLAAVSFFIVGLVEYVSHFSRTAGWIYLTHQRTLDYGKFFGVGTLGFLSYLIQPLTLFLVYCFAEGILRALEASLTGRHLGMAAVSLPWRAVEALGRVRQRARLARLVGPSRPDEVVEPANSRFGMLEIYSSEEKPWREEQIVAYGDGFFQLTEKKLVPRGRHHAWRYLLHELEEREVLRGSIVRYGDEPHPDTGE
jgi:hypothetical protein